jgi:hypothetical protein
MAAPFLIPAGMAALKIGGRWVLKKLAQRSKKKERKRERKRRGKEKEEKTKEARRYQKNLETPVSKLPKRDVKKKVKELKQRKESRRKKTEKELEDYYTRPSPTITKQDAIARYAAKKDALVRRRKVAEDAINPIANKAIAKLHKDFPQTIGGGGNAYGHGKGIGAKNERKLARANEALLRLMGRDKNRGKQPRQYKRENEQVAKQRRQRGEPERREVRRPKSGLYKDTPKKTEGTRQGQKVKNERLRKRKRIYEATEKAKAEKQKRTRELKEDAKRRRN